MRLAANRPITVEIFVHLSLDLLRVSVNFVVTHCKQVAEGKLEANRYFVFVELHSST